MITDLEELKEFVEWCSAKGVRSMQMGDVKFELSDYALLQGIQSIESQTSPSLDTPAAPSQPNTDAADDEELLMWSARP